MKIHDGRETVSLARIAFWAHTHSNRVQQTGAAVLAALLLIFWKGDSDAQAWRHGLDSTVVCNVYWCTHARSTHDDKHNPCYA